MDTKVWKILVPSIIGVFIGVVVGYGLGTGRTNNRYIKKQRETEQQRKEIELAQVDSIYLSSNVVWKKQELKSRVYSVMFDDMQAANIDKLKKHSALNNPYWQEINILFDKLSPYCSDKIRIILEKDTEQKKVNLFQLYNDLQLVRREVVKEIGGVDVVQDTIANSRLVKLEERDLSYLKYNNIWEMDSIWSQKYVNFMIGMLSGNSKVFMHTEINNLLWQEILRFGNKRSYYLKEMIQETFNPNSIDIAELHAMTMDKGVSTYKESEKQEKKYPDRRKRTNYQEDSLYLRL